MVRYHNESLNIYRGAFQQNTGHCDGNRPRSRLSKKCLASNKVDAPIWEYVYMKRVNWKCRTGKWSNNKGTNRSKTDRSD